MRAMARRRLQQPYNIQKGVFYEGLVATRAGSCDYASTGASFPNAMSRSGHVAVVDIRKLKIAFGNFTTHPAGPAPESAVGGAITIKAGIEYNGNFSQILFNGQVTGSVSDGGMIISDYAITPGPIPKGQTFQIRMFINGPNNWPFNQL